jgi:hypothetical protein
LRRKKLLFSSISLSDETSTINHQIGEYIDPNFWHPPHLAGDNESNSYYSGAHSHSNDATRRTSVRLKLSFQARKVFNEQGKTLKFCRRDQTTSNQIR